MLGMLSCRSNSNSSVASTSTKTGAKPSKPRLKICATDSAILKRNAEMRNVSDFIIKNLLGEIVSGGHFVENLSTCVSAAPSGKGIEIQNDR